MDRNGNSQCANTHTYTHTNLYKHTPYRPTLHNSQPLPNRNQEMEETMLHVAICVIWFGFVKKVGTLCLSGSPILRFNYAPSSLTSVFGQVSQFSATLVPLPIFSWGSSAVVTLFIILSFGLASRCEREHFTTCLVPSNSECLGPLHCFIETICKAPGYNKTRVHV